MTRDYQPSILVVDDEPELRNLLAEALDDGGVEVRTAASGAEAMAAADLRQPDLMVTDLCLGDCNGLEVLDRLRARGQDVPAVFITGFATAETFSEASRRHPVELMTKPLDLDRLRSTIREELSRQAVARRQSDRADRLRLLARQLNTDRKQTRHRLESTCEGLTTAYRTLSEQMATQELVLALQTVLLGAKTDDDVFRTFFKLFVHRAGSVFGVALACDGEARLRVTGRFGVPKPDGPRFCNALAQPIIDQVLSEPQVRIIDASQHAESFDESIRKYVFGMSILAVPLVPAEGQLIGLVVLYRKGEHPFSDKDVALAELMALPTAVAVGRND